MWLSAFLFCWGGGRVQCSNNKQRCQEQHGEGLMAS